MNAALGRLRFWHLRLTVVWAATSVPVTRAAECECRRRAGPQKLERPFVPQWVACLDTLMVPLGTNLLLAKTDLKPTSR
jgi:hypothetical protein